MAASTRLIPECITQYPQAEVYDGEIDTDAKKQSVVQCHFARFSDGAPCLDQRLYAIIVRNGTHVLFQAFKNTDAAFAEKHGDHVQCEAKLLCQYTAHTKIQAALLNLKFLKELISIVLMYDSRVARAHALVQREINEHRASLSKDKQSSIAMTLKNKSFLARFAKHPESLHPVATSYTSANSMGTISDDNEEQL